MKVIFLDIDGVLNCETFVNTLPPDTFNSFTERKREELNPIQVQMMSQFADEMDAGIVISSTWRKNHSLKEITEMLISRGWGESPIIGMTPSAKNGFRGSEIVMWLDQHATNANVTHCVIFDDGIDFYPHQPLVLTTWEKGLTEEHFEIARLYLWDVI